MKSMKSIIFSAFVALLMAQASYQTAPPRPQDLVLEGASPVENNELFNFGQYPECECFPIVQSHCDCLLCFYLLPTVIMVTSNWNLENAP
jgi:hypothetical protein